MSYKNLRIYKLSWRLVLQVHKTTFELPLFEMYETGAQIRRSTKSVKSNIVEGYGRRKYKNEFIRFMIMSQASNDESIDHLDTLYYTGSLKNDAAYQKLRADMLRLGKEINRFIKALETKHNNW
jgi:four helix bundle protein